LRSENHIKPQDMKFVPKSWGWELWIVNNEMYCGKILFIKQGKYCSYHYHEIKDEVLYIQQGKINFTYEEDGVDFEHGELGVGEAFHVIPGVKHQMEALEDTYIIEFSTQHFDEDSKRVTRDLQVKDKGVF